MRKIRVCLILFSFGSGLLAEAGGLCILETIRKNDAWDNLWAVSEQIREMSDAWPENPALPDLVDRQFAAQKVFDDALDAWCVCIEQ
ncbi:MAG: hypothetical protein H6510_06785 [Acidobacteria bacterium]|nr:hypothetical protein [Acidobacteriota bacterium]MCB9397501.1 hypothetical protein [Acidobacteriota bacterium]